jgi:hypothetical protein
MDNPDRSARNVHVNYAFVGPKVSITEKQSYCDMNDGFRQQKEKKLLPL